jgi:hypothetical protein
VRFSSPPLLVLLAYGLAFAAMALGTSVPVFDDHPGQLYRVWHVVQRGPAPWAWNPGWWAGYPEMQFYPPGFAYAGAGLHAVTLGVLSVETAYLVLVWTAYLAPGLTAFWLLARLVGSGWAALPGAFVALTFSAGAASGVEDGVRFGMIAARLAWALLPVLVGVVLPWANGVTTVLLWAAPIVLASIVITHPTHLPAGVVIVVLAALARPARPRRLRRAVGALMVGAGLSAFWTLPLLARLAETRPLAWGRFDARTLGTQLLDQPLLLALLLGAGLATMMAATPGERLVARLPWVLALVVAVDHLVVEPLGVRWLPADRLADGAWLTVVLAAGFAAARALQRWGGRLAVRAAAATLAVAMLSVLGNPLSLWPRATDWPAYAQTARGLRLDALWSMLDAAPPGRVLFVRSAVPLVHGGDWWRPHTHVLSLTPIATGRAIVSGTFTHPSPVAAAFYSGTVVFGPITRLAEQLDGRELFGQPLEVLDAATFTDRADRLGVSAVVAIEDDAPRLRGFDTNPDLARQSPLPPFIVYFRRSEVTMPRIGASGHVTVSPGESTAEWSTVRIAYYPLWRATRDGQALETRRGPLGDLEVRVTGGRGPIALSYGPGPSEYLGLLTSAATLVGWIARTTFSRRRAAATPASGRG